MLELADVHTYYGNIRALRGISLSVAPGEIVTLIGANGAGKTTTLRTILGTVRPRRGTVRFNGQRLDTLTVPPREGAELQVLEHGHPREDPPAFRRLRDPQAHDAVGRERVQALAVEAHGAPAGPHGAEDRPQRRRLAGAVGADERDDLTGRDGQRDATE